MVYCRNNLTYQIFLKEYFVFIHITIIHSDISDWTLNHWKLSWGWAPTNLQNSHFYHINSPPCIHGTFLVNTKWRRVWMPVLSTIIIQILTDPELCMSAIQQLLVEVASASVDPVKSQLLVTGVSTYWPSKCLCVQSKKPDLISWAHIKIFSSMGPMNNCNEAQMWLWTIFGHRSLRNFTHG